MKKWVHKLINQIDLNWSNNHEATKEEIKVDLTEDRATLLYIIDIYNKHLFELDSRPVRKVREILDEFARELVKPEANSEKILFKLRQFFSRYRIDEYSYIQHTMEDFRSIIWDFVDQLSDDLFDEQVEDDEVIDSLNGLKEAVESNSIEALRASSREFIDHYVEYQHKREKSRNKRIDSVKKNLDVVKEKLVNANRSMRRDHLTSAFNRKSFDEQIQQQWKLYNLSQTKCSLIMLDIDHFKKINDNYGHDVGDFVLKELVYLLQETFGEKGFVARLGGEEFSVILPNFNLESAQVKAEELLEKIRNEVFVIQDRQLQFTISMGVSSIRGKEEVSQWIKRTDEALYHSKNNGRDQVTLSSPKKPSIAA